MEVTKPYKFIGFGGLRLFLFDGGPNFVHHPCGGRGPAGVRGSAFRWFFSGEAAPPGAAPRRGGRRGPPHPRKTNEMSTPGPRPDPGCRRGGALKSGPHLKSPIFEGLGGPGRPENSTGWRGLPDGRGRPINL